MASMLPIRLLRYDVTAKDKFIIVNPYSPGAPHVPSFDIVSYTWGDKVEEYDCGISGVTWNLVLSDTKLRDIKRLMIQERIEYL